MADIDVVRRGPTVWPWLIGVALVVAALLWMNRDRFDDRDDRIDTASMEASPSGAARASTAPLPTAVSAFVAFAEERPPAEVGLAHTYTTTGIDRLATALDAVATPNAGREEAVDRQLEAFRDKAERLKGDPNSLEHSNLVRDVFTAAVDVMAAVQQRHLSDQSGVRGQIEELRQSAEAVDGGTPLLDQTERVTAFFDRAAETLEVLARARRV